MSNFISWVPVISIVVVTIGIVITAVKAVPEVKNLRRRDVKDLLDLIDEAGNRFEKESANAWRNLDAKPPKGSFEDSLGTCWFRKSLAEPSLGPTGSRSGNS
jgi:hypothetical protein